MSPFAEEHVISPQDIADIAVYLEQLPVGPALGTGDGGALSRGRELYEKDCAACHGARGEGNAERFHPRVAAQHYRYLLRETRLIRDGQRGNANPDMVRAIRGYVDRDLEAVADYVSRMPPAR